MGKERDRLEAAVSDLLRKRLGGRKLRSIDRQLGWHLNYLSRLLGGDVRFRFDHLTAVLRVLDEDPATFFEDLGRWLSRDGSGTSEVEDARRRFAAAFDPSGEIEGLEARVDEHERRLQNLEKTRGRKT